MVETPGITLVAITEATSVAFVRILSKDQEKRPRQHSLSHLSLRHWAKGTRNEWNLSFLRTLGFFPKAAMKKVHKFSDKSQDVSRQHFVCFSWILEGLRVLQFVGGHYGPL